MSQAGKETEEEKAAKDILKHLQRNQLRKEHQLQLTVIFYNVKLLLHLSKNYEIINQ